MTNDPDEIEVRVVASVEGDAVVEGPQVVIATSGGPVEGTVTVSAVPQGDAVIDGPQIVEIISGPPGPMGPSGLFSSDLQVSVANAIAAISFEANVRASVDEAQADLLIALTARVGDAESSITNLSVVFADLETVLASQITTINAGIAGNAAAITTEATARATADSALASQITALTATVGSNTAAIATETTARTTADSALASQITALTATVSGNTAAITAEATTRATADTALATRATALEAETTAARGGQASMAAHLTQIDTARVDGDSALASRATSLEARSTALESEVVAGRGASASLLARLTVIDTARVNGDSALASRATALETELTNARSGQANLLARITQVDTARVDGDSALATRATSLEARSTAVEAEITAGRGASASLAARLVVIDTARVDGDTALASRATAVEAELTNARSGQANLLARITQVDTARVSGDTALASTLTTVSARADAGTASGAVRLVAQAGGSGVSAQYAWEIVAGSHLVGMRALVTSGGVSRIEFAADQFRIYGASGAGIPIFAIDSGLITLTGDVRVNGSLVIGTINGSVLPTLPDLIAPAEVYAMMYAFKYDAKGRVIETSPAYRLHNFNAGSVGSTGQVPYVSDTAVPGGISAPTVEVWGWISTGSVGRSVMSAATKAAARAAIDAAEAGAGGIGAHSHDAADIVSGQLGDARLKTYVSALASQYILKTSVDPQGRITGYSFATRAMNIESLALGGAGAIPYISSSSTPNETWGWTNVSAFAAASHAHAASDITSGTLPAARLSGGNYTGVGSFDFGSSAGDKLYLWSNLFGAGIESGTLTLWTGGNVRIRFGGTSVSTGTEVFLQSSSGLTIAGTITAGGVFSGNGSGLTALNASNLASGTIPDARLPSLVTAAASRLIRTFAVDAKGRVTDHSVSVRLSDIAGLSGGATGSIPFVSDYSLPNETWGWLSSTTVGRSVLAAADAAAGRAAIGAAAASHSHAISDVTGLQTALDGKAASSHAHSAADITSGTLAAARLATLVLPVASQYLLRTSVDAQGRITGYSFATRAENIESLSAGAAGSIPFVSAFSTPNETWGWIASSTLGRTLMNVASGAAALSAIGAASASHAHAASDITSGTLADARLPTLVTAAVSSLIRSFSVDAQGRVTAHTPSVRLSDIAGLAGAGAANRFPYVSAFSTPNETWGWMSIGTSGAVVPLLNAANTWSALQTATGGILSSRADSHGIDGRTGSAGFGGVVGFSQNLSHWGIVGYANAWSFYGNSASYSAGLIKSGASFYADGGSYIGNTAFVTLAASAAGGTIYLRPHGPSSGTGQAVLNPDGDLSLTGRITASGNSRLSAPANSNALLLSKGENGAIQLFQLGLDVVGNLSVTASGVTLNSTSDYRAKRNYAPIKDAELRVMAVRVYSGEHVDRPGYVYDYFIAHELQAYVPDAVTGMKDAVNDNGAPVLQGVDLSRVVPLHHAAIQVLFDEKDEIKKRIAALEAEIADLKKKAA